MPSNALVRIKEPEFRKQDLFMVIAMTISAVASLFVDEEAAEERRKQMIISMQQAVIQALTQARDFMAGSLASGLNVLLQYVTHFLQAAGIQVDLPVNTVTTEGVVLVAQWLLLLLICYGVIALAFLMLTFFLRRLWWLLKVVVALACFGLILRDNSVSKETMAIRLVCLVCVCILLSIRPWKDRAMAARIVHVEEQVKSLENRMREMERWRRRCSILSRCLMVLLCVVVFIVFTVYTVLSNAV